MCEVLDVSPSGFYGWLSRPPSRRSREDEDLVRQIHRSFAESDRTYGVRRVWPDLLAWGFDVGRERVARLMRREKLTARQVRRRLPRDQGQGGSHVLAANHLGRTFTASEPNQRWVADFTYIWATEGWLFVAVVIDLYSRRIVGWSMKNRMTADLVTDALMMAIWRRGPSGQLLHHSDQGSQYTSDQFQRLLAEQGIDCSMSRRGNCWDNAAAESFFSSLKAERTERRTYRSRDEARADVFDYIERFYNPRRRHSTLGYLSPVDYERQAKLA
jgi:putative transposase